MLFKEATFNRITFLVQSYKTKNADQHLEPGTGTVHGQDFFIYPFLY